MEILLAPGQYDAGFGIALYDRNWIAILTPCCSALTEEVNPDENVTCSNCKSTYYVPVNAGGYLSQVDLTEYESDESTNFGPWAQRWTGVKNIEVDLLWSEKLV